jgi:hypothetical protein
VVSWSTVKPTFSGVERLGLVEVRDGHDDDLECPVHGTPCVWWRLAVDCSRSRE